MVIKKLIGSGECPFCGKDNRVEVTVYEMLGIEKWGGPASNSMPIQKAMPNLSAEKREILISGICLSCQKMIFSSSNEENIEDKDNYYDDDDSSYDEDEDSYSEDFNLLPF